MARTASRYPSFNPDGSKNATKDFTFSTRMGVSLAGLPFRMIDPSSQAMPSIVDDSMANTPYQDALVWVHHCPKPTCTHEAWYVYPNLTNPDGSTAPQPYVSIIIVTRGNGKNAYDVNGGQFSMPFYFAISRADD